MKIYDIYNNLVDEPDFKKGYLIEDKRLIRHHDAIDAIDEVGHYEIIAEYPNGGKDIQWVIDVPGVPAKASWDEYEKIQRYLLYTEDELYAMDKSNIDDRLLELENINKALFNYMRVIVKKNEADGYEIVGQDFCTDT